MVKKAPYSGARFVRSEMAPTLTAQGHGLARAIEHLHRRLSGDETADPRHRDTLHRSARQDGSGRLGRGGEEQLVIVTPRQNAREQRRLGIE